jgi:hypothetical protein
MKYNINLVIDSGMSEEVDLLETIISNLEYDGYKVMDYTMLTEKEAN